jgi:HSP20 family protein
MMERYRPRRRSMTTWSPFREMEEMERMIEETFGRPTVWRRAPEEQYVWAPSIEMYEKENDYFIRMEIPGVNPQDVDISLSGDTLTVKGERKPPENIEDEAYQLCEVCYGSFTRSITLPEPVKAEKIEATFGNGILNLRVPKAEEVKPKQIKIKEISSRPELSRGETSASRGETGSRQSK